MCRGAGRGGFHPGIEGVAHHPVGVEVLDGAQGELALTGLVLRDVRQPQLIWRRRGEVPSNSSSCTGGQALRLRPCFLRTRDRVLHSRATRFPRR